MPTECSANLFGFASVEGRRVEAAFDGGSISSNAGALLLGATDRAVRLVGRFAECFRDSRQAALVEHEVRTLVGQRVFGVALGYEDLNDHDWLRHDAVMAVLVGKLAARRRDCAPAAGKSTLNRLELSRPEPTRYHKISHDPACASRKRLTKSASIAAGSIAEGEAAATMAALRPTKRQRPLIAIIGANVGTETTDYLIPYGILRRADVADVMPLATEPGPVTLYPAPKVEPQATIAGFDARHPDGADYVIVSRRVKKLKRPRNQAAPLGRIAVPEAVR
jgi:hypothetical protein